MERLNELYAYKEKYEKEKLFVEAKIAVVDDMIADEKAKVESEVVETEEQSVVDGIL
jgi:hypothetical protein